MEPRDVVLAIIYLNEKAGRKLNEKGVTKIAKNVGIDAREALEALKREGLLAEDLSLTERGLEEALKALERLEMEIKRGLLGSLKWASFKSKLVPPRIKGSCLGSP